MVTGSRLLWCEARLTNHADLVGQLGLDSGADDAAVVSAAVTRWGDDAPGHLLGAFAYAVDARGGPVITRDALGVMPAFWARDAAGGVHVSDSLAVLVGCDGVDRTPDERCLAAESIRMMGLCAERTAMMGVHRVPPGTTVHTGGPEPVITPWWKPDSDVLRRRVDVCDAADELRELLKVAVADHLAMVRRREGDCGLDGVAAHVSGGLDSTAVAFLAAGVLAQSGRSLRAALSWSPQRTDHDLSADAVAEHGFDERDLVEDLAQQLGAPAHFGPTTVEHAPWMAAQDPAVFPRETNRRESQAAPLLAGLGITHVLSGWGGDEFVSFNGRGTNRAIVRSVRVAALRSAYRDRRSRGQAPVRALATTLRPGLPRWLGYRHPSSQRPEEVQQVAEVAKAFPDLHDALVRQQRQLARASGSRDYQLALIDLGHLSRRMEAWHQLALRFGFGYGYPLLDRRLVEWALAMPPEVFRNGDHSRRVFRLAIDGIVPNEVKTSQKADPVLFAVAAASRTPGAGRVGQAD